MSQIAWETAMGMRGYAGSSAEREDKTQGKFMGFRRTILSHTPLRSQSIFSGKKRAVATLECGHDEWVTSTDLRRGWANCFKRECRQSTEVSHYD